MKHFVNMRDGIANFLCVMAIASFACALSSSSFTASAQPTNPAPSHTPAPNLSAEELAKTKAWRSKMLKTPAPKQRCFHLTYPNTEWQEVPCRIAPDIPYKVSRAHRLHCDGMARRREKRT
jgi:hypothetical protein